MEPEERVEQEKDGGMADSEAAEPGSLAETPEPRGADSDEAPAPPDFAAETEVHPPLDEVPSRPSADVGSGRLSIRSLERETMAPTFFLLLFFGAFIALAYVLVGFLTDLVFSFILVGALRKPFGWFRGRFANPWVASGATTAVAALGVVGPFLLLGYGIALEAMNAYGIVAEWSLGGGGIFVDRVTTALMELGVPLSEETLSRYLGQSLREVEASVVGWGTSILQNALSTFVHVAIILVMVFYLLVDGEALRRYAFALSPLPDDEDALLVDTFKRMARGIVVGNGAGSVLQGVLCGIGMWSVGLPSPLLWGAVMSLFAFLPLVGISIITVPASIFLYFSGRIPQAVGFLVFSTFVSLTVENVVKTKMMGKTMRMHDLLVFLCILGGLGTFGFSGLIYGPLFAMTYLTLSDLYFSRYRSAVARRLAAR